jgi:hypothetical protein
MGIITMLERELDSHPYFQTGAQLLSELCNIKYWMLGVAEGFSLPSFLLRVCLIIRVKTSGTDP